MIMTIDKNSFKIRMEANLFMKVLVINAGSSSLKYQLIDMSDESLLAKGNCEKIGLEGSFIKHTKIGTDSVLINKNMPDHKTAIKEVMEALKDKGIGVISDMSEINAVGHRIVHGGEKFSEAVIIDDSVILAVKECYDVAPLHNPPNIIGIEACKDIMPNTPMVGVFDTAFHQSMPEKAYKYAIPLKYYNKYGIRKYGFHGTSHYYVSLRAAKFIQQPIEDLKIVTCHLGNGASLCAVDGGKSIDTSMGFTPLEGLSMGTRSGDIDPAIIKFLMDKENLTIEQVDTILNKESGMLGLTELSSDFRDIEEGASNGDKKCQLAIDLFCYRVTKYIGAYAAAMGGIDVLVFTAGIGENGNVIREKSIEGLEFMGISIDSEKNEVRGKETDISATGAKVKTLIIPTNEELMIARETATLIG